MEPEDIRTIALMVAFAELMGKPVNPWEAHAALLRSRASTASYASSDHPERTLEHVKRSTPEKEDMPEHANVHCKACDQTFEIQWEPGNPKWMQRALAKAGEAHRAISPQCKSADLDITYELTVR